MSSYVKASVLALLIPLLGLCHCSAPRPLRSSPPRIYIASDTIRVGVGEQFQISLPSLAGAGYSWLPEEQSLRLMSYDSSYYQSALETPFAPTAAAEKTPEEVLVFTALKPGNDKLKLLLIRPWETRAVDSISQTIIITKY